MNYEKKIKVQAWVDGQMPAHEAARVADWVETDSEARELAEELRSVKVLLQIGEKPVKVEDSREFYWTQIARRIDSTDMAETKPEVIGSTTWIEWCQQWLVPVGGLAAIVVMIATVGTQPGMVHPTGGPEADTQNLEPVVPVFFAPAGQAEPDVSSSEGEVPAEDVDVLNLNVPTDANPNLQPGINERTIPSIENPGR